MIDYHSNIILFVNIDFRYFMGRMSAEKYRSSRPEAFYKNGVLRNFAKFTGKHLCQSLFFNKVAGEKDSGTGVFL